MIFENREFYKLQVIVSAATINIDNINIDFKGLSLYSEDEDNTIEIKGRRTIIESERCSEGLRVNIFILNEGTQDRIDYLFDEEYEISEFNLVVTNKTTNKALSYKINHQIGEQVKKKVPVEMDPELEETINYISDSITDGNECLVDFLYEKISGSKELQKTISSIVKIDF